MVTHNANHHYQVRSKLDDENAELLSVARRLSSKTNPQTEDTFLGLLGQRAERDDLDFSTLTGVMRAMVSSGNPPLASFKEVLRLCAIQYLDQDSEQIEDVFQFWISTSLKNNRADLAQRVVRSVVDAKMPHEDKHEIFLSWRNLWDEKEGGVPFLPLMARLLPINHLVLLFEACAEGGALDQADQILPFLPEDLAQTTLWGMLRTQMPYATSLLSAQDISNSLAQGAMGPDKQAHLKKSRSRPSSKM